ncbi:alpha-(1,3)-fucosyltransferase C-like [Ylistrum balloti]|uniref:alpha-(1,3)-fucosyltransferase C-like n=1 Tax=Ylistrum balloti TaxID=509963 RepID=UPI002905C1B5|nr:alpha-(1,3)-fucosyltransferase C-like [Ylistrum balloti]
MAFRQLLQSHSVQRGVCLISVFVTAVLFAQLNSYSYSYIVAATMKSEEQNHTSLDYRTENDLDSIKTILAYGLTRWLDEWVGDKWNTPDVFENCPVSKCVLTKEKAMLNRADAVMFRWDDFGKCRTKRKDGQIWILFEHESPDYKHKSYRSCYNDNVNWTCTYRRDSDFNLVYGKFFPHETGYNITKTFQLLRSKSKTAVGFISHCGAPSKRDKFVRELRSYGMDIDIYGKCGNLKCGGQPAQKWKGVWNLTANHQDHCFDVLDTRYKFYLSLENSLCEDYVTEKSLHLSLSHQIVPLIRDGAKRSIFHPPNSYVDTKQFKSLKKLAEHINTLSRSFNKYLEFFEWRRHYSIETVSNVLQSIFCDMCHRLHHQHRYKRLYKNLKDFYVQSHLIHGGKRICNNRLI